MAGGIFVDQPFVMNPKCIVFGILLLLAYWLLPPKNPFLLPVIFATGYILMAWYDYLYNCDIQLHSGNSLLGMATLDAWAKPQRRDEKPKHPKLSKNQEKSYKAKIFALHVFVIAPVLLYVALRGRKSNPYVWAVVGSMALLAFLYHFLRFFYPRQGGDTSYLRGVNLFHSLIIAPFLGYIAYYGAQSNPSVWSSLLGLALLTLIYHGWRLWVLEDEKKMIG